MATVPILTLDTLTAYQVRIDGAAYDLRVAGQLSVLEHIRLERLSPRLDALIGKQDGLSDDEAEELAGLLREVCAVILSAPAEIQARLSDPQRLEIVLTFTALSRGLPRQRESSTTPGPVTPSTGASARRGSRASTAARRSRG